MRHLDFYLCGICSKPSSTNIRHCGINWNSDGTVCKGCTEIMSNGKQKITRAHDNNRIKQIDQTLLLNNGILPTWYLDCYFKAESTLCQAEEESINASRRRNCVLAGLMREHQHKDSLNELPLYMCYIKTWWRISDTRVVTFAFWPRQSGKKSLDISDGVPRSHLLTKV